MHCWLFCHSMLERHVAFVERLLGGAVARHSLLWSSEADPDAALAVLEEAEEDRGVSSDCF